MTSDDTAALAQHEPTGLVNVRMPADMLVELEALATEYEIDVGLIVREAVRVFLDRQRAAE